MTFLLLFWSRCGGLCAHSLRFVIDSWDRFIGSSKRVCPRRGHPLAQRTSGSTLVLPRTPTSRTSTPTPQIASRNLSQNRIYECRYSRLLPTLDDPTRTVGGTTGTNKWLLAAISLTTQPRRMRHMRIVSGCHSRRKPRSTCGTTLTLEADRTHGCAHSKGYTRNPCHTRSLAQLPHAKSGHTPQWNLRSGS